MLVETVEDRAHEVGGGGRGIELDWWHLGLESGCQVVALLSCCRLLLLPAKGAAGSSPSHAHAHPAVPFHACLPACLPVCVQAVVEAEGKTKLAEREVERLRAQLRALGSRDDD